jgi:predicted metalloprotease with PDZ domain
VTPTLRRRTTGHHLADVTAAMQAATAALKAGDGVLALRQAKVAANRLGRAMDTWATERAAMDATLHETTEGLDRIVTLILAGLKTERDG